MLYDLLNNVNEGETQRVYMCSHTHGNHFDFNTFHDTHNFPTLTSTKQTWMATSYPCYFRLLEIGNKVTATSGCNLSSFWLEKVGKVLSLNGHPSS